MASFDNIIADHHPILYKIARTYTHDEQDFNDLYQEMLIQVWKARDKFRSESKMSTFLYRVCLNTAMTWTRNETRRKKRFVRAEVEAAATPQDLTRKQQVEQLYAVIRELRKDQRSLVLLYLEGKKYEEIAEILGISVSNVGVRINRLKKHLAQRMQSLSHELA